MTEPTLDAYLDRVLAAARAARFEAEVYGVRREETSALFAANRLKTVVTRQTEGCALRVIADGRFGFAASSRLDDPSAHVAMALATAPFGAPARLAFPSFASYPPVSVFTPAVVDLSTSALTRIGSDLIAAARDGHDDVVFEGRVGKSVTSVWLRNSAGANGEYATTTVTVSLEGARVRGDDILFVGAEESSCGAPTDPTRLARRVRQQLELSARTVPAPSGRLPVLFTPTGVATVIEPSLWAGFNGKTVWQRASPLTDRLGERIADPRLTIVDDGVAPGRPSSAPFDGDGTPTQRTVLLDHGVVAAFYYDLQTAGLAGVASTGNALRALETMPTPGARALIISDGDAPFDSMLAQLADGLLVEHVIGADQGNALGGEFGGSVILGYRVRRGEIVGRVKDTMISGNVYDALNQIIAIGGPPSGWGADLSPWANSGFRSPPVLIDAVNLSAPR